MSKGNDITNVLRNIYYDLETESAWSGHDYGYEHMQENYDQLMSYMNDHKMDVSDLKDSYDKVVDEYNRIQKSKTDSFMNGETQRYFADLDNAFLVQLKDTAGTLANQLNLKDDIFHDESNDNIYADDLNEMGIIVDKVKTVRVGEEVSSAESTLHGSHKMRPADLIAADISSEFEDFLKGKDIDVTESGVYADEKGTSLQIEWASDRHAVCKQSSVEGGVPVVTEIEYNPMQLQKEYELTQMPYDQPPTSPLSGARRRLLYLDVPDRERSFEYEMDM